MGLWSWSDELNVLILSDIIYCKWKVLHVWKDTQKILFPMHRIYLLPTDLVFVRIVTNSSALDGWIPTVLSKCFLVAPHCSAVAKPWRISGESTPTMCTPNTRSVAWSTTNFMKVFSCLHANVDRIGVKSEQYTSQRYPCATACSSERPTVPTGSWEKTAQGILE